jgi:hypothetical protein
MTRKMRAMHKGKANILRVRNKAMGRAEILIVPHTSVILTERKLRKRIAIMEYKGNGWKKEHNSGKNTPATIEE